jgi:hypothetical protein
MNTFTSCGLPWHPVPDDGKIPCDPDQFVRVLLNAEKKGIVGYKLGYDRAALFPWLVVGYAGWYPVNPDGTEITSAKKPLTRPRVLRRRFPLARGVRPAWK